MSLSVLAAMIAYYSSKMLNNNRLSGSHGYAWCGFSCFSIILLFKSVLFYANSVVPAEIVAFFDIPSLDVIGICFLTCFCIFYLKPFKKVVSFKIVASILVISLLNFGLIYLMSTFVYDKNSVNAESYAIVITKAISLYYIVFGIHAFGFGKVNFLWFTLLLSVSISMCYDIYNFFESSHVSLYSSHQSVGGLEVFYVLSHILLVLGLYEYAQIFEQRKDVQHNNKNYFLPN